MSEGAFGFGFGTAISLAVVCIGGGMMYGCPQYNVYSSRLDGEAQFAKSQQQREIQVREATARRDAAKLLAEAEVERAKGVAAANKIIGDSLHGNEAYLRYLWIDGLREHGKGAAVIYVPTEAGLPILEAGRGASAGAR
jgi:regulator of protease activity HflC (stomatin/prohibitin superfamily)